jgi:hypothetical protein
MTRRAAVLVALAVVCVASAILVHPIAQPLGYHDFADARTFFGVPRFFDVASNLGFLAVGVAGLVVIARRPEAFESPAERWPYATFFVGLVLTAFGSAYYHLAPDNSRLVWDRLPIMISLAGLLTGQVADRTTVRAGVALLVPALIVGVGTVFYWDATERAGHGNLVPYAAAQVYAVLICLILAATGPSRYTRGSDIWWVFGWYVVAKITEALDEHIFAIGQIVSGHTVKHLMAAVSGFVVCAMLARRVPITVGRP